MTVKIVMADLDDSMAGCLYCTAHEGSLFQDKTNLGYFLMSAI